MFTDLMKRDWQTDFTFAEVFQLENENQVDLLDFDQFAKVLSKPSRLLAVLCVVCKIEEAGLSKADFYAGFNGDVLTAASESLWDSYTNFIPNDRRPAMAAVREAAQAMEAAMVANAMVKIQDARRGSLPELSESIQEPTAFAN
jgi:hypothetical protein